MKWDEIRKLYPNQFVKFEVVESHIEDGKEYVDEVAFIKAIPDGKEAMKEFIKGKGSQKGKKISKITTGLFLFYTHKFINERVGKLLHQLKAA